MKHQMEFGEMMPHWRRAVTLCAVSLVLLGCTPKTEAWFDPNKHDMIDRELGLNREDYEKMSRVKRGEEERFAAEEAKAKEPPIPSVADILTTPRPPKIGETQMVSIAVTDDVPLKDVLLELARLANVDIELDSGITGGVNFTAKDKPFNQVIERLSDLADLRYKMRNGVLRVERDEPYVRSYSLDFLNMDRSSDNQVNISTNVLSATGSSGGGGSSSGSSSSGSSGGSSGGGSSGSSGLNTGSQASITSTGEADFWTGLDNGLKELLNYVPTSRTSEIVGVGSDGAAAPAAASGQTPAAATKTFYAINRQAGVLTVSASEKQHEMVRLFLDKVQANSSAQVLIEAKIIEVALDKSYQSGINWNALKGAFSNGLTVGGDFNTITDDQSNVFSFTVNDNFLEGLDGFVRLTESFGTARTLSSPRLLAVNNQQAVLTFARNEVYFDISIERETDTSSSTSQELFTVDSDVLTVPIGIILTLQPSINLETNEVTLNVRPTISRDTGQRREDPAVAFIAQQNNIQISNEIPIIEVRELDSILKLKSGQVMVIGGLMEQDSGNIDAGMPYASNVPFLGNLFKSTEKAVNNKELIIFIKATIVNSSGYAHTTDEKVYQKYGDDPRPLEF